jgi:hypothetical protein
VSILALVALCVICMAPLVPDVTVVTTPWSRTWLRLQSAAEAWTVLGTAPSATNATLASYVSGNLSNRIVSVGSPTNRYIDLTEATNIYEDIVFSVTTLNPPGAATPATISSSSGQSSNQLALVFDANDMMMIPFQMPHSWTAGTDVYPHLHIEPQTTAAITSVWKVSYAVADIGSAFPVDTVVTQTVVVAVSNQWVHRLINVPTNGISMAGKAGPSTIGRLHYQLLSTTADIHLVSYDVHYRVGGTPVVFSP